MTRNEREELIRHYMTGEMSMAEEHDFFIQVALDNELRIGLKAHRTIDSAIRKDKEIDPSEYAPLGAAVATMLSASHGAPSTSGGSAGAGHAGWSLPGGSFPAALCAVGVMFGSLLVTPFLPVPSLPHPRASVTVAAPAAVPAPPPPDNNMTGGTISTTDVSGESAILNGEHSSHLPGKPTRQETTLHQEPARGGIDSTNRRNVTKPARQGDDSTHIGVRTIILPPKK
ncbi:MAG: hypothetical protein JWQ98_2473 [Chlorobi bacterium]|nr:hypothetical protein [Chlorobiota bacterium]